MDTETSEENKFWHGKNNRPFKEIFGNEAYEDLLKELLQRILKQKVNKITYLQTELKTGNLVEKAKTVDLLVETDKKLFHIEMNTSNPKYLHFRNTCYFFKQISSLTKVGEDYDVDYEFLHISFTYGLDDNKKLLEKYRIRNEDATENFVENIEIWEFNMDKVNNFWYTKDEENINNTTIY